MAVLDPPHGAATECDDDDDDIVLWRLRTYSDAAHAADSGTGASPVVCLTVGLSLTLAQTPASRLGLVLKSWTCGMINVWPTAFTYTPHNKGTNHSLSLVDDWS